MPFTICLVFQDGQNKFGTSYASLCSIIMFPAHVYTETMKMITKMRILETLCKVEQSENVMRFKKYDFNPNLIGVF